LDLIENDDDDTSIFVFWWKYRLKKVFIDFKFGSHRLRGPGMNFSKTSFDDLKAIPAIGHLDC
jgi:hypothetical protein